MYQIGETARYVRERLGLTQRAAAEALGVSSVHLSNVERGKTPPSSSLIARFGEVYGTDVYVLAYCLAEDGPVNLRDARRALAGEMQRALGQPASAV